MKLCNASSGLRPNFLLPSFEHFIIKIMEDPSSSKGSEFEDVWSELHSLKKLYGFLQKTSVKSPNVDGHDILDEKSRVLFKKLLDGATHQALQSQSKIVLYTPESVETPLPSNKSGREDEVQKVDTTPDKLLKCHEAVVHHEESKPSSLNVHSTPNKPKTKPDRLQLADPRICQKPCPIPGKLDLNRQMSMKSTRSCNVDKLQHHHHLQIDDRLSRLRRSTSKNSIHVPQANCMKTTAMDPTLTRKPRQSQTNGGGLLAVVPVPAQKRARVDSKATCQTRIAGRVDRELTHSKRSDKVGSISRNPPSRIGSFKDSASRSQMGMIDREKHPTARERCREGSREANYSSRSKTNKMVTYPKKKLLSQTTSSSSTSVTQSSTQLSAGKEPSRMPARAGPSRRQQTEAMCPRRMPSHHHRESVGPPRSRTPVKKEGRLRRFKDKLAIIFHHHHHHHLVPDDGRHVDGLKIIPAGPQQRHRSPWELARGILHRRRGPPAGGGVEEKGKVVARGGQHGYFHALLEGLIRHVWRTRRQKNRNIVGKKKIHWWQRLRRKGGVRLVSNKKRPRLRLLGFNRNNNNKANKIKKKAG